MVNESPPLCCPSYSLPSPALPAVPFIHAAKSLLSRTLLFISPPDLPILPLVFLPPSSFILHLTHSSSLTTRSNPILPSRQLAGFLSPQHYLLVCEGEGVAAAQQGGPGGGMLGGLEGSQARRMMRDDLSDDGRTPAPLAGAAHGLTHDTPSALILTGSNGPAMPADARQVAGNRRSLAAGGEGRLQCPMDLLDETLAHIAAELTIALIRLPDLSSRLPGSKLKTAGQVAEFREWMSCVNMRGR